MTAGCWEGHWQNLRLPYQTGKGRSSTTVHSGGKLGYEIDAVLLSPDVLLVIEVKNWSGVITVEADQWQQTRRDGSVSIHEDRTVAKERRFHRRLQSTRSKKSRVARRLSSLVSSVVVNKNCVLDDAVLSLEELSRRINVTGY